MITLLIGENSFEIQRAMDAIISGFDGNSEKIEGSELQVSQLPDILMGVSLFADKRLVIIRNLSQNKLVWPVFGDWLPKMSDDIQLVLIEPKPDKRTVTFKALKKMADVREFKSWTDRDVYQAEKWVAIEAKTMGLDMNKKCVQTLVQWVGVDQWQLYYALEKLALTDDISVEIIKNVIEPNPVENVLNLFETAIGGDISTLNRVLKTLEQTEDVYRLIGLLSTQAFQLAAVVSAQSAVSQTTDVARDFGIHPYVVSKLTPIAKRVGKSGISKIIGIFTELDDDMKQSRADPWLLLERALLKVANVNKCL
jgi:DNA polymerase III delta subunit